MSAGFSAYLQIYNDWSILDRALRSLSGHIDELVVVDGAYEWMVPYETALGRDPARSDPRVYEALEASGLPYRAINRVWKNQLEKRIAGYAACTHDYIFRVDADEIFFFDHGALDRFISGGHAVGDMTMPTYLAPGWLVSRAGQPHPRQCFLFDRKQVSAELHLNYLWLVLEADKRPTDGQFPFPVFPEPIAFNAHLTAWRTASTSSNRTAYYTTNWMRGHGVPWLDELRDKPLADFDRFFEFVRPSEFRQLLDIDRLSLGKTFLEPGEAIVPSEVSGRVEAEFSDVYKIFMRSLEDHNISIAARKQAFVQGVGSFLDISTPDSRRALSQNGKLKLSLSSPAHTAEAYVHTLSNDAPYSTRVAAPHAIEGDVLAIDLPGSTDAPGVLRELIEFNVWSHNPGIPQHFEIMP